MLHFKVVFSVCFRPIYAFITNNKVLDIMCI